MLKNLLLITFLCLSPSLIVGQNNQQLFTEFGNFIEKQTGVYPFSQKNYKKPVSPEEETPKAFRRKKIRITLDSTVYNTRIRNREEQKIESYTYDGKGNQTSIQQKFPFNKTIFRLEFDYDSNSNITEMRYCFQDTTVEKLTCTLKGEYFYENGKIVQRNLSTFDQENNVSTIIWKSTYTYEANGKMEKIEYFKADSLGNEKLNYRYQYEYEKNNTKFSQYYFHNLEDVASFSIEVSFQMNDSGRLIERSVAFGAGPFKAKSFKSSFIYNDKNNCTSGKYFEWNEGKDLWTQTKHSTISYNDSGKISEYISNTSCISNCRKIEFEYNNINLIEKTIDYKYEDIYLPAVMTEYEYDENENIVLKKYSKWSTEKNDWINSSKIEYSFDLEYDTESQITLPELSNYYFTTNSLYEIEENLIEDPDYKLVYKGEQIYEFNIIEEFMYQSPNFDYTYLNKLDKITGYFWDADNMKWEESDSEEYFYSKETVNVVNSTLRKITFSPNPTQNCFIITMNDLPENTILKLYNIAGIEVFEKEVSSQENIYIGDLSKGLYYVKLFEDNIDLELIGKLLIQ